MKCSIQFKPSNVLYPLSSVPILWLVKVLSNPACSYSEASSSKWTKLKIRVMVDTWLLRGFGVKSCFLASEEPKNVGELGLVRD